MNDRVAELVAQCRLLSAEERVRLLGLVLESLDVDTVDCEAAWDDEVARRVAEYERGEAALFDADEVMAEAVRIAP